MALCEAKTKSEKRCKNLAQDNGRFCHAHRGTVDWKTGVKVVVTGIGSLAGNVVVPGVGGAVGGGYFGNKVAAWLTEDNIAKKVFVSFDFDNDKKLKEFIIGQSKNSDSPFSVSDYSLKEAAPEKDWEAKAHRAIARSDIILVMVGPKTHKAHGVLKEVEMARDFKKPIFQIIGYKDGDYTAVPNAGRLYRWNWDNLKKLLA